MTQNPFVQLDFNPQEVNLPHHEGNYLGDLKDVMASSLTAARLSVIAHVRAELAGTQVVNPQELLRMLDEAWVVYTPRFVANLGPLTAAAYYRAFRSAQAGEVPTAYIEDLAEKHVQRTLGYFRETSAEALIGGFNSFVNQQVPAKVAAERVIIAYGLTNRQMSGYVAASARLEPKVMSPVASVKSKVYAYIERSLLGRFELFAAQEDHNISQEAQQVAWLWMKEHGQLTDRAMKMWITARDEKVCPSCGPLHGKKVRVENKFKTTLGEYWVPGLHPNCRCIVRLVDRPLDLVSKADEDDWDPKEHPRDYSTGRFARKPRQADPEARRQAYSAVERMLATNPETTTADRPTLNINLTPVETPPEPIDLTGEPISLTPIDMRQITVSAPQIDLRDPVTVPGTQRRIQVQGEPIDMTQSDKAIDMLTQTMAPPAAQQKIAQIKTSETYNIGHPLIAVIPEEVMNVNATDMHMDHNVTFYDSRSMVARKKVNDEIHERLNTAIEDTLEHIGYNNEYRLKTVQDHVALHAELAPDTWEDVISTIAYSGWNSSNHDRAQEKFEVRWYNDAGKLWVVDQMSAYDIGKMINVTEDDFVVPLARITRSHDSDKGEFQQVSSGTRYGFEEWTFRGPFVVYDHSHSGFEDIPNIRAVELVPDAEETIVRGNNDEIGEPLVPFDDQVDDWKNWGR